MDHLETRRAAIIGLWPACDKPAQSCAEAFGQINHVAHSPIARMATEGISTGALRQLVGPAAKLIRSKSLQRAKAIELFKQARVVGRRLRASHLSERTTSKGGRYWRALPIGAQEVVGNCYTNLLAPTNQSTGLCVPDLRRRWPPRTPIKIGASSSSGSGPVRMGRKWRQIFISSFPVVPVASNRTAGKSSRRQDIGRSPLAGWNSHEQQCNQLARAKTMRQRAGATTRCLTQLTATPNGNEPRPVRQPAARRLHLVRPRGGVIFPRLANRLARREKLPRRGWNLIS